MKKAALVVAGASLLAVGAVAAPAPAQAQSIYDWGPYGYYSGFGYPYGGYGPGPVASYSYGYDAPVAYRTTYYETAPTVVGYRHVVRPRLAFYGGPRWHHRWYGSAAFYGGPIPHHRWHRRW